MLGIDFAFFCVSCFHFSCVGRLEVKEESYQKLYETAGLLRMSVLTKLMDAQVAWLAYTVFAHPDPRFAILEPPSEC